MIARRAPRGRRPATVALAILVALALPAWGAWDIAALMQLLKSHPAGRARFVETKHVSILDRPLESSGELVFTPPDRLERRVTSPGSESMVVDRERLVVERGGRKQVVALAEHPEIAVLVESIRATLAGDREALERAYAMRLEGGERAWRLFLEPKDPDAARLVKRVEIEGVGAQVRRVEVEQADGDSSLMQITPVSP